MSKALEFVWAGILTAVGLGCTTTARDLAINAMAHTTNELISEEIRGSPGTNVTVNNNQRNKSWRTNDPHFKSNPEFGPYLIGTCNYAKDFNGNGVLDWPDEYVGVKKEFRTDEKIFFWFMVYNLNRDLNYKLFDGNGDLVESFNMVELGHTDGRNVQAQYNHPNNGKVRPGLVNFLNPGSYSATVYSGNRFITKYDFQVKN